MIPCSREGHGSGPWRRPQRRSTVSCSAEETHGTCCGFAGDRGFLLPELTAAARRLEAEEVRRLSCDDYVSHNRTCEIGMTRATGRPYRSVIHRLEESTRPDGKAALE